MGQEAVSVNKYRSQRNGELAFSSTATGVWIVSPRSSFVTGGDYKVDGGMLAALGVSLPE
jgi:hypothetical protein